MSDVLTLQFLGPAQPGVRQHVNMATLEPVEMRGHAGKDKYRASTDEGPLQHTHSMERDDFTLYMAAGREGGVIFVYPHVIVTRGTPLMETGDI